MFAMNTHPLPYYPTPIPLHFQSLYVCTDFAQIIRVYREVLVHVMWLLYVGRMYECIIAKITVLFRSLRNTSYNIYDATRENDDHPETFFKLLFCACARVCTNRPSRYFPLRLLP